MKRGRLGCVQWQSITDKDVRAAYATVAKKLNDRCRTPREAASCLNYLYHFAMEWNAINGTPSDGEEFNCQPEGDCDIVIVFNFVDNHPPPTHPADFRTLNGTQSGMERAHRVFAALCERQGWGTYHLREVRARLSRALACTVESLAPVVNPKMRRQCAVAFFAPRSHRTSFTLHECLPVGDPSIQKQSMYGSPTLATVRSLNPRSLRYKLICHVGERMADQLRSVSRDNVAALLLFLDRLLFVSTGSGGYPESTGTIPRFILSRDDADHNLAADVPEVWSGLRAVSARQWLRRYRECCVGRCIGFDLFRKEVRWLSRFHASLHPPGVGNATSSTPTLSIPVPCCSGRVGLDRGPIGGVRQGNFSSGSSSGSGGQTMEDHTQLRDLLVEIRDAVCRREPLETLERTTTFTIEEIHRIVVAAESTLERLVIALFVSTGLRLGGLCRLRMTYHSLLPRHARDVPKSLVTVEKGRKQRTVHINTACHTGECKNFFHNINQSECTSPLCESCWLVGLLNHQTDATITVSGWCGI